MHYSLELGELIDLAVYLGKFEPGVVSAIERFCQPGMTVLDIGANIGAHALRLGKIVGKQGHVYAFEPTTFAFSKLERNVKLNPEIPISTFRIALANETATQKPISFRASWRTDGKLIDTSCCVDFIRLDEWAHKASVDHIDLIKIDVDGNEYDVLAGGIDLLRRCKPMMLMEMVGPHFADPSRNPFALLSGLGYQFSNIDTGTVYSGPEEMAQLISSDDSEMTTSINILATPGNFKNTKAGL